MSFEFYEDEMGYISCTEVNPETQERIKKFIH